MSSTKEILKEGDILEDEGYIGVVYVHDITWKESEEAADDIQSATVDVYLAPISETNIKKSLSSITDHRVIMEDLNLWSKFEKLLARACNEDGRNRLDFRFEEEKELFYGFTRKYNQWYCTSCTLNSWILRIGGKDASGVVKLAGVKGADKSKADLINEMSNDLWTKLLPRLHALTPHDITNCPRWTRSWADGFMDGPEERVFEEEQLARMRSLVCHKGRGSYLFELELDFADIGQGDNSAVQALATVLLDKIKRRDRGKLIEEERCTWLQRLNLSRNHLTDEHIALLCPAIKKCRRLKELRLSNNEIGNAGCEKLCSCLPNRLMELDLSFNKIEDSGCEILWVRRPKTVKFLDLRNNNIGKDGCDKVIEFSNTRVSWLMTENPGYTSAEEEPTCWLRQRCVLQ